MISAEFNSWFSDWFKRTACFVKTDCDVSYTFIFNAEHGVIGAVATGEQQ